MGTRTYQTKRCPKCHKVYGRNMASGPYGREKLYKFGPVFKTCNSCGAVFRDSDTFELAVMDPPKEMAQKFHVSNIVIAAILGGVGIIAVFMGSRVAAHPFGVLLFCLFFAGGILWGDYRRYQQNMARIDIEKERSIKRLKEQPQYAVLLKAAGFSVPEEYLPQTCEARFE